jgi:hypothetical protein
MTTMQTLLGNILRNRINAELKKEKTVQNFTTITEAMDIFLAGDKITADQYAEFTNLINPVVSNDNSETAQSSTTTTSN